MDSEPVVYGLDIETDTATDGLDPQVGRILAVAVASAGSSTVFTDADEAALLDGVAGLLAVLPPGVLVTWNGAAFDLPYLATRAQRNEVALGLCLRLDPHLVLRGDPLPGHGGAYRASWHGHGHLDAYRLYRHDVGRSVRFSCALKSIARLAGLQPIDHDASRVHELSPAELCSYVASDARCARELALRRWPTARAAVDRAVAADVAPDLSPTPVAVPPARVLTAAGALR